MTGQHHRSDQERRAGHSLRIDQDPHPDPRMESQVHAWLVETDLTSQEAESGLDRVLYDFPVTPQVRGHLLGRWLRRDDGSGVRDAGRGDASDSGRRNTLVLSAVAATAAAVAIAVLAIDIVRVEPVPDMRVRELLVAADGTGHYTTIVEAVADARDGDTVRLLPGTYAETIVIDKDITLTGAGRREEVVITSPESAPAQGLTDGPTEGYAVALMGADAEISNLTFTGEHSALLVHGGDPTLRNLYFLEVTEPFEGAANTDQNSVVIAGGSRATISDSRFERSGPLGVYASDPTVVGNTFEGGSHIWGRFGDHAVISDNHIDGALSMALWIIESGPILVEGNVITGSDATGIDVGSKGDSAARVLRNRIVDAATGITVRVGDGAEISGNELVDTGIGVQVARFNGHIADNRITGGDAGIVVVSGGAPRIADNVIDVSGRGIVAGARTSPLISGNEVCGGEAGIHISDGATPQLTENQDCADDAVKL